MSKARKLLEITGLDLLRDLEKKHPTKKSKSSGEVNPINDVSDILSAMRSLPNNIKWNLYWNTYRHQSYQSDIIIDFDQILDRKNFLPKFQRVFQSNGYIVGEYKTISNSYTQIHLKQK